MKKYLFSFLVLPSMVLGAAVVNSFDAPDTGISALAWDGTSIWAIDGTTQQAYQLDPSDGTVLSNFYMMDQTAIYNPVPGGATYLGGSLFVTMYDGTSYGMTYKYDGGGGFQGYFDVYC